VVNGLFASAASSDVIGIVLFKKNSTLADIVLAGLLRLPSLSNAVDGPLEVGRYYLSSAEPGKLVSQRPPVTVSVAFVLGPLDPCDQSVWAYVMPQTKDFLEDHIHYSFKLAPVPAGSHTPPLDGERHVITAPDDTIRGWLPADDPVFAGKAPTGAVWGYNIGAHEELERSWPPVPLAAAYLDADSCSVPRAADDTCARLRAVRRRRVAGSPLHRIRSRKGEGLPGYGTVLFVRAVVVHPAGYCPLLTQTYAEGCCCLR